MTAFVRNAALYGSVLSVAALSSSLSLAAQNVAEKANSAANKQDNSKLEQVIVQGVMTANNQPVGTYSSPISNLEYDPRIDLQSRNMAEAQADVTIRGGIFESTGFRIGSATLIDPQTGHYFAEIPIAPEMLSKPNVLTGADNALYGVNSSVGSISYAWLPVRAGGSVSAAAGNNALNVQRVHSAMTTELDSAEDWTLGLEAEYSRSESDGSIEHGDHDYDRASGRVQLLGDDSQTDLFFGYQSKFFGWPNMYTPFGVNETEDLETKLLMFNHQQSYGSTANDQQNSFEVSAYYRRNSDHYIFSRERPTAFQAFHKTAVKALAVSGRHGLDEALALNYSAQFTADSIDSTTLEQNFTSRRYMKLSVLPEYEIALQDDQQLKLRLGAAFDKTNRDESQVSAIADIHWLINHSDASSETFYLSYAEASQVVGYTAIGGSETGGLFRSNHDLGRERTKNLELGMVLDRLSWSLDAALFYRWDNELTDWTFNFDRTSARSANPVDIETLGIELIATKRFDTADIVASYTHLNKSEDYGSADVDASFYALNYPDHRFTLAAIWRPVDGIELRIDNEWRQQQENALRNGDDEAFFTHLTASYFPEQLEGLEVKFAVDNLWDESFEEVPGTPGRGDQYSLGVTYRW
ncbi:MAG: TonB-dependent receptor [Cellvibrionaceae bacterium]|nr:TonB-dependent receptor [Cellvibrionaceae bacterium]